MPLPADHSLPWYKEPWPWVVIAIPGSAVIMGFITLYLALSNPDHLVVEQEQYQDISSDLRAQSPSASTTGSDTSQQPRSQGAEDGEH
jgi:hypothetical protein